MMKKLLMTCTLCFGLVGNALAYELKVVCELENDSTNEILATGEAPLSLEQVDQSIVLEADFGKHGKAILRGYASLTDIPEMEKTFVTISTRFELPKFEMVLGDMDSVNLGATSGDIANSGSLIVLGKDIFRFGCEIRKE